MIRGGRRKPSEIVDGERRRDEIRPPCPDQIKRQKGAAEIDAVVAGIVGRRRGTPLPRLMMVADACNAATLAKSPRNAAAASLS